MSENNKKIQELEEKLNEYANNNFKEVMEKMTLEQENEDLKRQRDRMRHIFKVNTVICFMQFHLMELCKDLDFAAKIRENIITYQAKMADDALLIPGTLSPLCDDSNYNPDADDER